MNLHDEVSRSNRLVGIFISSHHVPFAFCCLFYKCRLIQNPMTIELLCFIQSAGVVVVVVSLLKLVPVISTRTTSPDFPRLGIPELKILPLSSVRSMIHLLLYIQYVPGRSGYLTHALTTIASHRQHDLDTTPLPTSSAPVVNFFPGLMLGRPRPRPKSPNIPAHTRATGAAPRPSSRQHARPQSRSPMYTVPPRAARMAGRVVPMPLPPLTRQATSLLVPMPAAQHRSAVGTDNAQSSFAPAQLQPQQPPFPP